MVFGLFFNHMIYDRTECKDISIVQDNIVEPDEQFSVQIMSSQPIPASVQGHLHINSIPSVITYSGYK